MSGRLEYNLGMTELTERLIREVRSRPVIYLPSHPDHKNIIKKAEAWKEIEKELDENVVTLKAKWKNLRDTYKKYQLGRLGGGSKAARKLHRWLWAESMAFMDGVLDERAASPAASDDPLTVGSLHEVQHTPSNFESTVTDRNMRKQRRSRKGIKSSALDGRSLYVDGDGEDARHEDGVDARREDAADVRCDGDDLLFLGYAHSFKKLSRRRQIHAKFAIAKVLMEAELGDLDDASYDCYEEETRGAPGQYTTGEQNIDGVDVKVFEVFNTSGAE